MKNKRTFFVCLISNVAVDNLSLRGGVLETLVEEKDPEDTLVFLTASVFAEKFAAFKGKNVVLEYIDKIPPHGILQKAFHFFYSYLIFTGTTKILATFGARVDVPPAGRNRHAAFFKWLVANTFGRSTFVKTRIVPSLFLALFSDRPYKGLFDRYIPSGVFVPNIAFFPDIELIAECKRRGIPTVGMACNWDHLNKYYIPLHVDRLLIQNDAMRKEAIELHEYEEKNVELVGFAQFDIYKMRENFITREAFRERFRIPVDHKIILFISGAAYAEDEPDILQGILQEIRKGTFGEKVTLMIRPYAIARDLEREKEKYKQFEGERNVVCNWLRGAEGGGENRAYYVSMMHFADVIISIFSTTAIEAALLDKPTITIGFDGYKKRVFHRSIRRLETMSHFKHVLNTGAVRIVRSFAELFEGIVEYLGHPHRDTEKRQLLVERMTYKQDGRVGKRVAGAVLTYFNDHKK